MEHPAKRSKMGSLFAQIGRQAGGTKSHQRVGLIDRIPYDRIVLAGFSQGGALALYTGIFLCSCRTDLQK